MVQNDVRILVRVRRTKKLVESELPIVNTETEEDKKAREAGWKNQEQRQRFLDSSKLLAENIRKLAEAIQRKYAIPAKRKR